ncbi:DUF1766-domain-containing protein [Corynespora cassiicola Philippines]|uniref:DUF1766-domain-containing protein n=1 Tax=Corynespora cassiicola Philippines TaxID=1448308 RepID=A0A2T2NWB5_CORCC|nr:DUF1766-domain-containing protein [Corynespora cassiicola Philippines]
MTEETIQKIGLDTALAGGSIVFHLPQAPQPDQDLKWTTKTPMSLRPEPPCSKGIPDIPSSIPLSPATPIPTGYYVEGILSSSPISDKSTDGFWSIKQSMTGLPVWENGTPITPHSTTGLYKETTIELPESPLARRDKSGKVYTPKTESEKYIKSYNDIKVQEYQPRKLFKDLTSILNEEMTRGEVFKKAHSIRCNLDFDCEFSYEKGQVDTATTKEPKKAQGETLDRTSTRKSSKSKTQRNILGKTTLDEILPPSLHERIPSKAGKCIASLITQPNKRCNYRAKKSENINQHLAALNKSHDCQDYPSFLINIRTLISSILCGRHYNAAMRPTRYGVLEELVKKMNDFKSQENPPSSMDVDWATFLRWADMICQRSEEKKECTTQVSDVQTAMAQIVTHGGKKSPSLKTEELITGTTTCTNGSRVSWQKGWVFWQPKWSRSVSIHDALQKTAQKSLTKRDLEEGYIYMFWLKGSFGLAKIGYSKNVDQRLKQWTRQCGHQYQLQKSSSAGEPLRVGVPHARRLEKMIHTELKEFRMKMECKGCHRKHEEWFEVSEQDAMKAFVKWRDWIQELPYEESDGKWNLKTDFRDRLGETCRPLELSRKSLSPQTKNQKRRPSKRFLRRVVK